MAQKSDNQPDQDELQDIPEVDLTGKKVVRGKFAKKRASDSQTDSDDEMREDVQAYDDARAALERGDEHLIPESEVFGNDDDEPDLFTLLDMLKSGEITEIPDTYVYQPGDYDFLNRYRKRYTYVKVEITTEQYQRLAHLSRVERIPMRYIVTRAVQLYINDFPRYGSGERGILRDITPFND